MPGTTTDSLSGRTLFRCDKCGARVPIVMEQVSRRNHCIDCLDPKDQAVFRGNDAQAADSPEGKVA